MTLPAIADHSPARAETSWNPPICHDCTEATGHWIPWPCPTLAEDAEITPAASGWHITPKAGA
ncbi:hypothetical protein [Streptomyces sp. NRRL B-24484]|uniref:hypothetical protein n=1 Tax=Streptomyces sp. NRRL B-24484 TaxID=1463833 RepID=UPI0004C25F2B|nr:hypothetical protein [Streptomyces sp. NRRL B-24484]